MGWHPGWPRDRCAWVRHTHVPTADERGAAGRDSLSDRCGHERPLRQRDRVEKELVLRRFLTGMPAKFEAAKGNPKMCATLVACDPKTGRATRIQRIMLGE